MHEHVKKSPLLSVCFSILTASSIPSVSNSSISSLHPSASPLPPPSSSLKHPCYPLPTPPSILPPGIHRMWFSSQGPICSKPADTSWPTQIASSELRPHNRSGVVHHCYHSIPLPCTKTTQEWWFTATTPHHHAPLPHHHTRFHDAIESYQKLKLIIFKEWLSPLRVMCFNSDINNNNNSKKKVINSDININNNNNSKKKFFLLLKNLNSC